MAIETSGDCGGVAVGAEGRVLAARRFQVPKRHAAAFLPSVNEATREAGVAPSRIRFVYVSIGPGSFTGLRIGLACARSLAFANGAQVVAVPSLQVIAQNALESNPVPAQVVAVVDAKRGHVYAAEFTIAGGLYEPASEPAEVDPREFLSTRPEGCAVLGDGLLVAQHRAAFESVGALILDESLYGPRPATVYRLGWLRHQRGEFTPARALVPLYIRPPESEERWQQRRCAQTPNG